MYTQCPQCRTIFEISEDALQASLGIVRCGHCAERFDALRTLSDTLPAGSGGALPEHDPDVLAPILTSAVSPEPAQVQAAAPSLREPASKPAPPGGDLAATQPGETWFDALSNDRARALLADAAGIPPEAVPGESAWQIIDLPLQTSFTGLDIIPVATAVPAMETGEPNALAPAPANAGAAESGPFTDAWGLDIAEADLAGPADTEEAAMGNAAAPSVTNDAGTGFMDSLDVAVPLSAAEMKAAPDSWALDDQLRAGDNLPADTIATEEERLAAAEPQGEPPADKAEPAGIAEPVYVPPRRRRIRRSDWLWATGCAVLALALAAQVAWARRVALVRDPATQAQALRVCARFDCRLPPIRDTANLELLSRDVRPDPAVTGTLAITATFRNNAPYRQPWPVVVVELTDLDNNVVAMRRFRPVEYMPDATRRTAGIAAGSTAAVAFEVADPGKRAVSFHFGFD